MDDFLPREISQEDEKHIITLSEYNRAHYFPRRVDVYPSNEVIEAHRFQERLKGKWMRVKRSIARIHATIHEDP